MGSARQEGIGPICRARRDTDCNFVEFTADVSRRQYAAKVANILQIISRAGPNEPAPGP